MHWGLTCPICGNQSYSKYQNLQKICIDAVKNDLKDEERLCKSMEIKGRRN